MGDDKNTPDIRELYGEFVSESTELIGITVNDLIALEKNPSDEAIISKVLRSMHTLKGNSGFLGLTDLSDLAHKMENVLGKVRDKAFPFFPEINDAIFKGLDAAKDMLKDFLEGKSGGVKDLSRITAAIEALMAGPLKTAGVAAAEAQANAAHDDRRHGERRHVGRRDADVEGYMRVSTTRLDKLVNLVGELTTGKSRLMQLSAEMKSRAFSELASFIAGISAELQTEVLSLRMVPISQLFEKYHRLVRDISKPLGKDVELVLIGEETELDKTIIEELNDPLLHMVRNSIGHGLESPEERERLGKPRRGTLILKAYHEHNSVCIEVEDDGRGLNPARIKAKAVEKGLAGEAEAASLGDAEAVRFIFLSGFSTAEKIDGLAGRGVGMDVVKTNIEKLGGSIDVDFEEGAGTRFLLKMPLTLAIVQLFLLKEAGNFYGIPLGFVDETLRIKKANVDYIKGQMVYRLRHHAVPLVDLSRVFDLGRDRSGDEAFSVLIVRLLDKKVGIIVDGFMGKVETVIKPLGKFIDKLPEPVEGISGASILGTGEIVMVLDVPAFFRMIDGSGGLREAVQN